MVEKDPLVSRYLPEDGRTVVVLDEPWDLDIEMGDDLYLRARLRALWHPHQPWYGPTSVHDVRCHTRISQWLKSGNAFPIRGCFEGFVHFDHRRIVPGILYKGKNTVTTMPIRIPASTQLYSLGFNKFADGRYYLTRALASLPVHGQLSYLRMSADGKTLGFRIYPAEVTPDWMIALNANLYNECMTLAIAAVVISPCMQEINDLALRCLQTPEVYTSVYMFPRIVNSLMEEYVDELARRLETTPAEINSRIERADALALTRQSFGLKLLGSM